jgi:hypothetical protein
VFELLAESFSGICCSFARGGIVSDAEADAVVCSNGWIRTAAGLGFVEVVLLAEFDLAAPTTDPDTEKFGVREAADSRPVIRTAGVSADVAVFWGVSDNAGVRAGLLAKAASEESLDWDICPLPTFVFGGASSGLRWLLCGAAATDSAAGVRGFGPGNRFETAESRGADGVTVVGARWAGRALGSA